MICVAAIKHQQAKQKGPITPLWKALIFGCLGSRYQGVEEGFTVFSWKFLFDLIQRFIIDIPVEIFYFLGSNELITWLLTYGWRKLREIQHVISSMVLSEMAQPAGFSGELKVRSARTICVAAIERRQAKQKGPMRVWSRDPGLKILQSSWVGRVVRTPTCCYSFFPEILLWKITITVLVDTY